MSSKTFFKAIPTPTHPSFFTLKEKILSWVRERAGSRSANLSSPPLELYFSAMFGYVILTLLDFKVSLNAKSPPIYAECEKLDIGLISKISVKTLWNSLFSHSMESRKSSINLRGCSIKSESLFPKMKYNFCFLEIMALVKKA